MSWAMRISLAWVLLVVTLCLLGPLFSGHDPEVIHWDSMATAPNAAFWWGTDVMGRDLMVRVFSGGRTSLWVALVATTVSVLIGVSWGLLAGYFGGRMDVVMMRLVDVLYALPFMFLVILLLVFFGQSLWLMFVGIGAYMWLDMARIVRGQTQQVRRQAYVEASHSVGQSDFKIIWHHVLPNVVAVVLVYATLTIPQVILIESFLSFLGLGVQEPMTSWGALVSEGAENWELAPWALWFPAAFLSLTLLSLNLIGDGLRDRFDVKKND